MELLARGVEAIQLSYSKSKDQRTVDNRVLGVMITRELCQDIVDATRLYDFFLLAADGQGYYRIIDRQYLHKADTIPPDPELDYFR